MSETKPIAVKVAVGRCNQPRLRCTGYVAKKSDKLAITPALAPFNPNEFSQLYWKITHRKSGWSVGFGSQFTRDDAWALRNGMEKLGDWDALVKLKQKYVGES